MIGFQEWDAVMSKDGKYINVSFKLTGVNKPAVFVKAFQAEKGALSGGVENVLSFVFTLASVLIGLFKKSK